MFYYHLYLLWALASQAKAASEDPFLNLTRTPSPQSPILEMPSLRMPYEPNLMEVSDDHFDQLLQGRTSPLSPPATAALPSPALSGSLMF